MLTSLTIAIAVTLTLAAIVAGSLALASLAAGAVYITSKLLVLMESQRRELALREDRFISSTVELSNGLIDRAITGAMDEQIGRSTRHETPGPTAKDAEVLDVQHELALAMAKANVGTHKRGKPEVRRIDITNNPFEGVEAE